MNNNIDYEQLENISSSLLKGFISWIEINDSKERLGGTISSSIWLMTQGIQILRVHDLNEINQAIKVFKTLKFT